MGTGASRAEGPLLQSVPSGFIQPQSFYFQKSEKSALLAANFIPILTSPGEDPKNFVDLGWKEMVIHLFYSRDITNPAHSLLCLLFYDGYDSPAPVAVVDLGVLGVAYACGNEIGTPYTYSYTFVVTQGFETRMGPVEVKIGWSSSAPLDQFMEIILQKQMAFEHLIPNAEHHLKRIRGQLKGESAGDRKMEGMPRAPAHVVPQPFIPRREEPPRRGPPPAVGVHAEEPPYPHHHYPQPESMIGDAPPSYYSPEVHLDAPQQPPPPGISGGAYGYDEHYASFPPPPPVYGVAPPPPPE
jgi:hypothetical protein